MTNAKYFTKTNDNIISSIKPTILSLKAELVHIEQAYNPLFPVSVLYNNRM